MKSSSRILISLVVAVLAALGGSLHAADHPHDRHQAHAPAKLQLDRGAKWPTDAPLRQGMETLRSTFAEYLIAIRKGRLAAKDYATLGAKVDSEVGNIVAQCKLEPKADAMLHLVVADLLNAAAVMRGKAPGKPAAAARQAVHAVNNYGRYFDHPQWQPLG